LRIIFVQQLVNNYNFTDPTIPAEQVTTGAQLIKDLDLEVAHKSMVWSIPKYESFIIHEISLINNGSTWLVNVKYNRKALRRKGFLALCRYLDAKTSNYI